MVICLKHTKGKFLRGDSLISHFDHFPFSNLGFGNSPHKWLPKLVSLFATARVVSEVASNYQDLCNSLELTLWVNLSISCFYFVSDFFPQLQSTNVFWDGIQRHLFLLQGKHLQEI